MDIDHRPEAPTDFHPASQGKVQKKYRTPLIPSTLGKESVPVGSTGCGPILFAGRNSAKISLPDS